MLDILTTTDAPTPSGTTASDTGAVIGGTTAGVTVLMMLVILLLGCFFYNKRRKKLKLSGLHERYIKFCVLPSVTFQNPYKVICLPLKCFCPQMGSVHHTQLKYSLSHSYNLLLYIAVYL